MFLLRCAFWLSVVYGSIFWAHGAFSWDDSAKVADSARNGAKTLLATAASGATDLCARHMAECLADAAKLTSLFRASEPSAEPEDQVSEREQVAERDVPMPIPDPRRHARDAKRAQIP